MSTTKTAKKRYTHAEWIAEAERRFGKDAMNWAFICPICKHITKVRDWKQAKAPEGGVAFNCVGRYLHECRVAFGGEGPGPCNYTGGGLFPMNPIEVEIEGKIRPTFDFAPETYITNNPSEMSAAALEAGATEEEVTLG